MLPGFLTKARNSVYFEKVGLSHNSYPRVEAEAPEIRGKDMDRAIIVRGNLSDPKHIELDEPVTEVQGPVEVVVRAVPSAIGAPLYRSATPEVWKRAFHTWVEGHDRSLPLPAPESLRREALYDERP